MAEKLSRRRELHQRRSPIGVLFALGLIAIKILQARRSQLLQEP